MSKLTRTVLWILGALGAIALILRLTILKVWVLPTEPQFAASVEPSMSGGDTVLVLTRGQPAFGDLVRCTDPDDPTKFVVGRIAGLGGDKVVSDGRSLSVNGTRYESQMACPKTPVMIAHPTSGSDVPIDCEIVQMGGGWHYRGNAQKIGISSPSDALVGPNMVYLLSDDRTWHEDSRDFGALPAESCKERIFFRLWGRAGWNDEKSRFSFIR